MPAAWIDRIQQANDKVSAGSAALDAIKESVKATPRSRDSRDARWSGEF